jgi:predicted NACHT family NTPase
LLAELKEQATTGPGWPAQAKKRRASWAKGPKDLEGERNELVDVLARVPTGRLAVLGEVGAGKTMLMVRLVLDLLARRGTGGRKPVPVLASLASWDSVSQDLRGWLVTGLSPSTRSWPSPRRGPRTG